MILKKWHRKTVLWKRTICAARFDFKILRFYLGINHVYLEFKSPIPLIEASRGGRRSGVGKLGVGKLGVATMVEMTDWAPL